ncbi:type III secretion system inner membrane ring lipoprotein SctJ [Bordetella genomosp. 9]|uniref:Lipoprotein n=1 Tax=Bordetella genomosp. 9 TaxID=1416803 RepID=A0A1W6YX26_9BORD|nr:type III secretion inner membrane ring lipoprotein SctJ [Bordetella genomosp. 9]ARP85655.1 EscJ/YscJ/HrcJ family type III secretion inner membrane ring protein [Bordetella genomosp. 9]
MLATFCVLVLVVLAGCSPRVELFSETTDAEANEMLAALLQSNIRAVKEIKKTGVVLTVPEADVGRALQALRQRGLPRERYEGMGKIFHKDGMISSPLEERVRYVYALSQELENTLSKLDGVLVARVHVVLPEQEPGKKEKTESSAAVFIKYQPGNNVDLLRPQIRALVARAIPDLDEGRVSVILVAAHPAAAGAAMLSGGAGAGSDVSPAPPAEPEPNATLRYLVASGLLLAAVAVVGGLTLVLLRRRARNIDVNAADSTLAGQDQ